MVLQDEHVVRVWEERVRPEATKPEAGRGHGTWSMKLFGEEFLGGRVSFETSPVGGTTFQIAFPR